MKKLLFIACMVLTVTSGFAGEVGENDTDCAEMIQSSRNAGDVAVDSQVDVDAQEEVKAQ